MKTDHNPCPNPAGEVASHADASKLLSLLALAAGAVAIPQTGHADIIFTDLSTNNVTIGPTAMASFLLDNLPGTARLGFQASHIATSHGGSSRSVRLSQKAGYVRLASHNAFAVPRGPGVTWNQVVTSKHLIASSTVLEVVAAANSQGGRTPASFDHEYLLFKFKDSTQVGSPLRYGWIDVSLFNPGTATNTPLVTVWGYAFDNTGAPLPTGTIPEPAPVAMLALGALTLGATGVRAWRRNRPAPTEA
jgi:hypothetical protein